MNRAAIIVGGISLTVLIAGPIYLYELSNNNFSGSEMEHLWCRLTVVIGIATVADIVRQIRRKVTGSRFQFSLMLSLVVTITLAILMYLNITPTINWEYGKGSDQVYFYGWPLLAFYWSKMFVVSSPWNFYSLAVDVTIGLSIVYFSARLWVWLSRVLQNYRANDSR